MNNILKQAKELEEWFKSGEERNYPYWIARKKKEATKLLKIAREGCGKKFETVYIFGNKVKVKCPFKENGFKDLVCPDCQEAIKILEEVHKR